MEKEKALDVIKRQIGCYKNSEEQCFTIASCRECNYNATFEEIIEAMQTAISALEMQTVDKTCETCKHKTRLLEKWRCRECYRETNREDYWEPCTKEEL